MPAFDLQFVDSIGEIVPEFVDTFTRNVASGDWGAPWVVGSGDPATFSVNGSSGLIAVSAVNVEHHITVIEGSAAQDLRLWCTLPVVPAGAAINWGVLLRYSSPSNHIWVDAQVGTDSVITLRIIKRLAGVTTVLASVPTSVTHSTSVPRAIRAQVDGATIRARLWSVSGPEPTSWQAAVTDGSLPTGIRSGAIARLMSGNTNGPVTFQFDNVRALTQTAVRLDLNDDVTWRALEDGTDFGMPTLSRAVSSTLLTDGDYVSAAAYGNRTLALKLQYRGSDFDAAATAVQALAREIDRPGNFLRYRPATSRPVFFRTVRSDFAAVDWNAVAQEATVTLVAEPFAYGLREMLPTATVSNDPADGSWIDITGVKGDVEAPVVLHRSTTNIGIESLIAVRRGGDPSGVPLLLQAEAMTVGTDTAVQLNTPGFSPSTGNNISRVTFATTSIYAARLSTTAWPSAASADARGTYRVFGRMRKNGATSTVRVRLRVAGLDLDEAAVTGTAVQMVDLGLVQIPTGADPVFDGPSGLPIPTRGPSVEVWASRTGGSDTLDVDYLLWVPADDRLAIVHWPASSAGRVVVDGVHDLVYASAGDVTSGTPGYHVGGLPTISPGVTNRIFVVNEVAPAAGEPSFPVTAAWDGYYWPRYLMVRGTS